MAVGVQKLGGIQGESTATVGEPDDTKCFDPGGRLWSELLNEFIGAGLLLPFESVVNIFNDRPGSNYVKVVTIRTGEHTNIYVTTPQSL